MNKHKIDMKDLPKALVLLTAGFAAGVVAGVLFAPEMGEKTRETLKEKAGEIGDELKDTYTQEIDKLQAKIAELKEEMKAVTSENKAEDAGA